MTEGLEIRMLGVGYGRKRVVRDATLPRFRPGELVALVGPNAAGKSTLMRALAGLLSATGEVLLDGVELLSLCLSERARRIAFMPQSLPGGVGLSVLEGVLTALKAAPLTEAAPNAALRRRAFATLERFGIERLALEPLDRLSGGQRQLASLAQATVREPRLLLLDEPTSALDLAHQLHAMRLVRAFARDRSAIVVVVLHDLSLAARWADRIAVLADGAVAAFGTPAEAITPETLRLAYGVEAKVDRGPSGHLRIEVEDASIAPYRDAS